MERALYDPGYGYYTRSESPWEGQGDFVTGPQVHAAFGGSVAQLLRECDAVLGEPACIDLVEMGGGDGSLLADICDATRSRNPALYGRLRVWSIERSATLGEHQRRRLAEHGDRVRWASELSELPGGLIGLVVSNELVDALPVHRLVWRDGEAREFYVDVEGDRFVQREGPLSTAAIVEYLQFNDITLAEGQVAELCLAAASWLAAVDAVLESGLVLTIDYGADTGALYAPERREGSLVCQFRYQLSNDPYVRVGDQDVSAHVDFGNLRRRGARLGLEVVGESGLAVFLVGFGAADGEGLPTRGSAGFSEALRRHQGLRHLLFSEMGDAHRVLLQAKHMPAAIEFGRDRLG